MKKKSASQSAFFNLRVLIGLLIVVAGVSLALFATVANPAGRGAPAAKSGQKYNPSAGSSIDPLVPPGFDCSKIHELGIDKQENFRAGAIMIFCGLAEGGSPSPYRAVSRLMQNLRPGPMAYGAADRDLINHPETSPDVTQSETFTTVNPDNPNQIVVAYNDSRGRFVTPINISGASVSTDGGLTFDRLTCPDIGGSCTQIGQSPFTNTEGDPVILYNKPTGTWFTVWIGAGFCGAGLGGYHSTTPWDPHSWTSYCVDTTGGGNDDRESGAADNNTASPFFGRMYVSWNNFGLAGPPISVKHSTDNGATWGTAVNLPVPAGAVFVRNVQITVDKVNGDVYVAGMDENGGNGCLSGCGTNRRNIMYRSTDGGVTFTNTYVGPTFVGACRSSSGYFCGMYSGGYWRHMSWGEPAAYNHVVSYVYAQKDGSDPGNVYYIRSTDSGVTFSAPFELNSNTDVTKAQWQPNLSVSDAGTLFATWYDERNGGTCSPGANTPCYQMFSNKSPDNGVTWQGDMALSDVVSPLPAQPDPGIVATYVGDYDYGSAVVTKHATSWADGRVLIGGQSQQDAFTDRELVGFSVTSTTPACNSLVTGTAPVDFVVNLSDAANTSTVQPTDFTVNNIPANSDTLSNGNATITFHFNSTPVVQGINTMHIPAGAILRASDNAPIFDFTCTFCYAPTQLMVTTTVPPVGGTFSPPAPGDYTYDVNWNIPVDPTSVQTGDLSCTGNVGCTVTAVTVINSNMTTRFTVHFNFGGTVTMSIAAGAITAQGNACNGNSAFTGMYGVSGCPPGQYTITPGTDPIVPGITDTGSHCDDCITTVALPFPFLLYTNTYNSVNLSSNGNAQFVTTDSTFVSQCIPWAAHDFAIHSLFEDLRTDANLSGCSGYPGGTCGIFVSTSGSAPNRIFNIEWRAVLFGNNASRTNFELRIYENSPTQRFDLIYGEINGTGASQQWSGGVQGNSGAGFMTSDFCNPAGNPPPGNRSRAYAIPPCGTPSPTPTASPSATHTPTATPTVGGTGTPTATPTCAAGWSAGPNLPTVLVRAVGVYFPTDGNFYTMGGRTSDVAGSDFQHVLKYNTTTNSWSQQGVTLPDNQMNNMACGVLSLGGTPEIYCVGGSAAGQAVASARVFYYNPVTDTVVTLGGGDNWPGNMGTILPGGFAETGNKMYILGGFNINVGSTNQIWSFDPNAAVGSKWALAPVTTPEGIMYAPTCAIGGIIYVGGASDFQGGLVVDTTNSFSFNPAANTIGMIAPIPRATGETRALTFNGNMYVMGGGRVSPNPSNIVNIYNPGSNIWSTGIPFNTPRRNFPTDTNGTNHIWLGGGYASDGVTPLNSMEIFAGACPSPTPTPTVTGTPSPTPTCMPSGLLVGDGLTIGFGPNNYTTLANNIVGYTFANGHSAPNDFALFQTHDPWGATVVKTAITSAGHTYTVFTPAQLVGFNFNAYRVVILNWDDTNVSDFDPPYSTVIPQLQAYVNSGGVVWVQGAIQSGGGTSYPLPFGGIASIDFSSSDPIVDPSSPMVAGVPNPIVGNFASHVSDTGLPAGAHVVVVNGNDQNSVLYDLRPSVPCGSPTATPTVAGSASPTPTCTPSGFRVLIAYSDTGGPPTTLVSQILAEPGVIAVDLFDASSGTPTLAQLTPYNIVVPFSNNVYSDPTAMGNVLADYEDQGGLVVGLEFNWYGPPFGLLGRWMTGGYSPYNPGTGTIAFSTNTATITQNCLTQGVTTLTAFFRMVVTLSPGAVSVANWTDAAGSAVAYKANNGHTAVGVNAYLGQNPQNYSGQWGHLIVNAGRCYLAPPCGTPSPTPTATRTPTPTATATGTPSATPTCQPGGTPGPWSTASPYPIPIVRYGFAQTATHFYVFGGVSNGTRQNVVNRLNLATGMWESRAVMPFTSEAPTCALMAATGLVYCAEGDTGNHFASYNIATDMWTPLASDPFVPNHYGSASGAFNGKVFVAGGGSGGASNTVQVYDVASNMWSSGTVAPNTFLLAGYQEVGQYLYVIGGFGASPSGPGNAAQMSSVLYKGSQAGPNVPAANNATSLRLDMSSAPGVWTTGPAFTEARADFGLAYDAGTSKLYAMGGDATGGGFFDSTVLVDELAVATWPAGTWMPSPPNLILPNRQANQAGFYGLGQIWSVGGIVGQTFQFLPEVQRRTNGGVPCVSPTATPTATATATHTPTPTPTATHTPTATPTATHTPTPTATATATATVTATATATSTPTPTAQRQTPTPRPRPTPTPRPPV